MLMVEPTRKKVIDALNRLDGFVMPFQFTEEVLMDGEFILQIK